MVLPFISFPFRTFLDVSSWLDGSQVVPNGISIGISKKVYRAQQKHKTTLQKKGSIQFSTQKVTTFEFPNRHGLNLNLRSLLCWNSMWPLNFHTADFHTAYSVVECIPSANTSGKEQLITLPGLPYFLPTTSLDATTSSSWERWKMILEDAGIERKTCTLHSHSMRV